MSSELRSKKGSRVRKILRETLLIIGITAVIILAMEGILRLFFPQNLRGERIKGGRFSEADKTLGYRYAPGSKWRFLHPEYEVEYEINRDGFRDKKEHIVPKPPGTIRVLLVGDSFTFGQGVNYEQSWPVIVEKRLEKLGYGQIDLVKAGIQGMDTRSEFIIIQQMQEKYDCDVVVIGFLVNDVYTNSLYGINGLEQEESSNIDDPKATGAQTSWAEGMKNLFIRNDRQNPFHLLTFARRLAIANPDIYCKLYLAAPNRREWLVTPLQLRPKRQIEITGLLFEKISAYCSARATKLIILSIAQQFQVLYYEESMRSPGIDVTLYDRYFENMAEQSYFYWIATLDAFISANHNGDELFYRLDGHLTPAGNDVLAGVFIKEVLPSIK